MMKMQPHHLFKIQADGRFFYFYFSRKQARQCFPRWIVLGARTLPLLLLPLLRLAPEIETITTVLAPQKEM